MLISLSLGQIPLHHHLGLETNPKEIRYLVAKGELQRLVTEAGAVIDGARKKKAKKL